MTDPILRELFHNCALVAYVEEARERGSWPRVHATRERAYRLFEEEHRRERIDSPRALCHEASPET